MATDQRHSVLVQSLQPTPHDFTQDRSVDAPLWKTRNCQSRNGRTRHCPHVVDGIQSRNAPVVVGIVNDGREEVERLHQREVVTETVYSRVVGGLETDNQVFVKRLFW